MTDISHFEVEHLVDFGELAGFCCGEKQMDDFMVLPLFSLVLVM